MLRVLMTLTFLALGLTGYAKGDTLEVLHTFNGANGERPQGGLTMDADNNLYGTTYEGGSHGYGTVFRLTPNASKTAWTQTVLYSLCVQPDCSDGMWPFGDLIVDADGNLYGTTIYGGIHGAGTIFQLTPNANKTAWTHAVLHSFCAQPNCSDGALPYTSLTMDGDDNLYGTTYEGGDHRNGGTIFRLTPDANKTTWTHAVVYSFCAQFVSFNCLDGNRPSAGLIVDGDGNLYGSTISGGSPAGGTVFQLTPNANKTAWTHAVLHSFCAQPNCSDGVYLYTRLTTDADGNLYGTTFQGGVHDLGGGAGAPGTVFRLTPNASKTAWTHTVLYSFCAQSGCSDGKFPTDRLIMDAAGNLYGTAAGGLDGSGRQWEVAIYGHGVVFQLTPNESRTAWTYTVLYSFCSQPGRFRCLDGHVPSAGLTTDADGNLYGTAAYGGTPNPNDPPVLRLKGSRGGTVFVLKPS